MIITLVCKDCDKHRIVPEDAKDKPFDLSSRQPITITTENGKPKTVPFSEWVKKFSRMGRDMSHAA